MIGYLLEGWSRSPPISGWATSSSRTGWAGCEPGDLVTNRDVLTPLDLGRMWSGTLEGDGCHLIYFPERLCGWCPGGLGWLGRRCCESRGLPRRPLPGPDEGQWEMMGVGVLLRSAQTWEIFLHWTCRPIGASLVAHKVKYLPAVQETWVWSLSQDDPLEKGPHSSILVWRIPWTEKPGRL